ncbi:hypothetical protein ACUN0C_18645 [Faunimonas sp. B44]|uniref:hypothetical protein n=1 Tax=Faunimonas sp. B44 TaxID=3461493 RepID=UPI0040445AE2
MYRIDLDTSDPAEALALLVVVVQALAQGQLSGEIQDQDQRLRGDWGWVREPVSMKWPRPATQ